MKSSFRITALRLFAAIAAFGLLSGCGTMWNSGNSSAHERTENLALSQSREKGNAVDKRERTRPHRLPDGSLQLGPDGKPVMVTETDINSKTPEQVRYENANNGMENITKQNADNRNAQWRSSGGGFWTTLFTPTAYPVGYSGGGAVYTSGHVSHGTTAGGSYPSGPTAGGSIPNNSGVAGGTGVGQPSPYGAGRTYGAYEHSP